MKANFLNALNAYNQAASTANSIQNSIEDATASISTPSFESMIKNPLINDSITINPAANSDIVNMAVNGYRSAKETLRKSEIVSNKALTKEASLVDLVTATSNAKITIQTMTAIRNECVSALQDILKTPI